MEIVNSKTILFLIIWHISLPYGECQLLPFNDSSVITEERIIEMAESDDPSLCRRTVIGYLMPIVTERSVPLLLSMLSDTTLNDMAAAVLISYQMVASSDSFDTLLREKALEIIDDEPDEASLLVALSLLKESPGKLFLPSVAELVGSDSRKVRLMALNAIAAGATDEGERFISGIAFSRSSDMVRVDALTSLIRLAGVMARRGNREGAASIARNIKERGGRELMPHIRIAALSLLWSNTEGDSFDLLLEAMKSDDREYRSKAMRLASTTPGSDDAARWLEAAETMDAARRAEVITMLGEREDAGIAPSIVNLLSDDEGVVRVAAAGALSASGSRQSVNELLDYISGFPNPDDQNAGAMAIATLSCDDVIDMVAARLNEIEGVAAATLAGIITWSGDSRYFDMMRCLTDSDDEGVRAQALISMKSLATEEHSDILLEMLPAAGSRQEINEIQQALYASLSVNPDKDGRVEGLLELIDNREMMPLVLPVIARLGGERAAGKVCSLFRSDDTAVSDISFEALISWSDIYVAECLLEAYLSESRRYGRIAYESYIRVVKSSDISDSVRVSMLRTLAEHSHSVDHRAMIIDAASSLQSIEAMRLVAHFYDDEELSWYAVRRSVCMALPEGAVPFCGRSDRETTPLSGPEVTEILRRGMDVADSHGDSELVTIIGRLL